MVSFDDVKAAAQRLRGIAHRTPVVTSRLLDERLSARLLLKCENLQRAGAFKFRGAYNALSKLLPEERARGVLAYSSGNHAQAIALASRMLGAKATIVMPSNAPTAKRKATEGYGARIVVYEPAREKREEVAERMRRSDGLVLIPPYDHADVIAGQGTAAAELIEARLAAEALEATLATKIDGILTAVSNADGTLDRAKLTALIGKARVSDSVKAAVLDETTREGLRALLDNMSKATIDAIVAAQG